MWSGPLSTALTDEQLQAGLLPPSFQHPAASEPAAADVEEDTLKRKLEELTGNVSDQGASSEEEGEDDGAKLDRSTPVEDFPRAASEVRPPQQSWKDKARSPAPGRQPTPGGHGGPLTRATQGARPRLTARQTNLGSEQTGAS